jgi:mannose-6-phosphate isomerase class I
MALAAGMSVSRPNYDLNPITPVAGHALRGWEAICAALTGRATGRIVVELYPGADKSEVIDALTAGLRPDRIIDVETFFRSPEAIDAMLSPYLGDDPVFGKLNRVEIADFLDPHRFVIAQAQAALPGLSLVVGAGASIVCPDADEVIYVNMARWPLQLRFRQGKAFNLGTQARRDGPAALYKRAFFVDWRSADRLKTQLMPRIDWVIDGNEAMQPRMVSGADYRAALNTIARRPFRVRPFFDPGPWGGQWMRQTFGLPESPTNYAWCFDCVPEENSLLLGIGDQVFEAPAIDAVLNEPELLLGEDIVSRFGAEFPIRFDLLDTMGGGNLSLQVHPRTAYMRDKFGVTYTQDESYYVLAAASDAIVCLGLKSGIDREAMATDLRTAQLSGGAPFPAETYVNQWPVRTHDHLLIPGGTIHCSGADIVVLEISATPYIYTFKLWDWGRLGLDGKPRPIHIDHGLANIAWERDTEWTRRELVNAVAPVADGKGWREERTGLHALQFIETRRHWFDAAVAHDTGSTVNVLNLVSGEACLIESPDEEYPPFVVHYAETFIVPAAVGAYTVSPLGRGPHATLKAFVRKESAQ